MTAKEIQKRLKDAEELRETAISALRDFFSAIEEMHDEQEEAVENIPESLKESENGQRAQERLDALAQFMDDIDTVINDAENLVPEIE